MSTNPGAIHSDEITIRAEDVDARLCDLVNLCLLKNPFDRLRFVGWSSFILDAEAHRSVDQRIAKLLVRTELTMRPKAPNPLHESEQVRTAHVHLGELCKTFREELDAAIGRLNGVFPPRETEVVPNLHPKPCITCTFPSDSSRHIRKAFKLQFALNQTEGSAAVEAYARASRGVEETEIGWTHLGGFPGFVGLRERLLDWMLEIAEELIEE